MNRAEALRARKEVDKVALPLTMYCLAWLVTNRESLKSAQSGRPYGRSITTSYTRSGELQDEMIP